MFDIPDFYINETFDAQKITMTELELLLSDGWRHFGTLFFRYNLGVYQQEIRRVIPLRIRLSDLSFSKSQRRNMLRNRDLIVVRKPLSVTADSHRLFEQHKLRFTEHIPNDITEFVPMRAVDSPSQTEQFSIYDGEDLIAESYFDISEKSISGIYAMFDQAHSSRGLGIFTMLCEIEYARSLGKDFYYLGYVYEGSSFYDYKKRFRSTEAFDWKGNWLDFDG